MPSTRATTDEAAETTNTETAAAMFDPSNTVRLPNGTDRWNAYAGSCHGGD
ncbi:hypothetical protein [Halorubrum sp. BV1]|uniref:hypothetical protein n=1 Tax=Halorubrum sp. BV1 TaxID=1498500 RepID=UPI000B1BF574|nr:hypothetical protein [Halorubrum sp. BV1]